MAGFSSLSLDGATASGLSRGDPVAQAEAYRLLAPPVLGMAQRILGDRGLAEEVVQDTFVSVLERADTVRDPGAIVGWVRQIAVNHCLMRLRSPWRRRRVSQVPPEAADALEDAPRSENLRDLERALAGLGAETRMVLWLHDVEGYTHEEIGTLFGKTSSYSKSRLTRGYRKLLDQLGDETDDRVARAANVGPACAS
jgi:RNA polymerase sigma-70 factor (ECF subfamily)